MIFCPSLSEGNLKPLAGRFLNELLLTSLPPIIALLPKVEMFLLHAYGTGRAKWVAVGAVWACLAQ